jgi:hypothetical protein
MEIANKNVTSSTRRMGNWRNRVKEVSTVIENMATTIKAVYGGLTKEEGQLFEKLIAQAKKAETKLVTHSYITDMGKAIIAIYREIKYEGQSVFEPLIADSADAAARVRATFEQTQEFTTQRGPLSFPAGATSPTGTSLAGKRATTAEYNAWAGRAGQPLMQMSAQDWPKEAQPAYMDAMIHKYQMGIKSPRMNVRQEEFLNAASSKFYNISERYGPQQAAAYSTGFQGKMKDYETVAGRMGMTPMQHYGSSNMERWGSALQSAQAQNWGLRSFGYEIGRQGRSLATGGMGILGGAAGSVENYIEFADPLERSARNLELNAEMTELLNEKLRDQAGIVTTLTAKEQAEGLYQWAAATGATVGN